jgi:hypothetical protein
MYIGKSKGEFLKIKIKVNIETFNKNYKSSQVYIT